MEDELPIGRVGLTAVVVAPALNRATAAQHAGVPAAGCHGHEVTSWGCERLDPCAAPALDVSVGTQGAGVALAGRQRQVLPVGAVEQPLEVQAPAVIEPSARSPQVCSLPGSEGGESPVGCVGLTTVVDTPALDGAVGFVRRRCADSRGYCRELSAVSGHRWLRSAAGLVSCSARTGLRMGVVSLAGGRRRCPRLTGAHAAIAITSTPRMHASGVFISGRSPRWGIASCA